MSARDLGYAGESTHSTSTEDRGEAGRIGGVLGQTPAILNIRQRKLVGAALVEMLLKQSIELVALSLDAIHYHLLARFGDRPARELVGRAKKHATFTLQKMGLEDRLWGKRARVLPIRDRDHQVNVFNYIVRHRSKGAWTWRFRGDHA